MMKIAVLGAGLVGSPMGIDLSNDGDMEVTMVDINQNALDKIVGKKNLKTVQADLSKTDNVCRVIEGMDLVINAVPGFMGFNTLKTIIEQGKNVVDIAFFPENPFDLDELAKQKNITAIVDCGVAPGMSNVLTGHTVTLLDKVDTALTYVGGLPEVRHWPYEYKAVFSPIDVIEEYTRPARYIENGKMIIRPALSDVELINFPEVGTLEVFNTDGLRTMAETLDIPNMKEKTMRYPGHIEKMAVLRETGLFSKEEIEINGTKIRPIDFTSKLLFPMWEMKQGEKDITVMRVIVEGEKDGEKKRYTYDLIDRYDDQTQTHSMAKSTGYTATVTARLIVEGRYTRKGISPPEYLGRYPKCVEFLLKGLAERNVVYKTTVS